MAAAARSIFRSSNVRNAATNLASQAKSARSSSFYLPSKTPLLAHQVPNRMECVLGVNAAVPHRNCLSIDDVNAHYLSMRFWLAPGKL